MIQYFIVIVIGLLAIGYVGWQLYKALTGRSRQTGGSGGCSGCSGCGLKGSSQETL